MKNKLPHLIDFDWKSLENIRDAFIENPTDFSSLEAQTEEFFEKAKQNFIINILNALDRNIFENPERKKEWYSNRHDEKDYFTTAGKITFTKTLYTNKKTGESRYLIDDVLGIDPYERLSDNTKVKIIDEATQTSYRKAGEVASATDNVSKSAVKDLMHSLQFPEDTFEDVKKKRWVPVLYIEADEDHEKLQFQNEKGDLQTGKHGRKNNGIISKLIYVHEGVKKVSENSDRHELSNPHFFASSCGDIDNEELWNQVDNYIQANYDTQRIPYIFLMADGGGWIKTALKCIPNLIYVLDEFHLNKYINRISKKFWDSADDVKKALRKLIEVNDYAKFDETIQRLCKSLSDKNKEKVVEDAKYIANNWNACYLRLKLKGYICGCSAEAHISHVLASRMSSRPMAWCELGTGNMVQALAYKKNNKCLHELVAYQKFLKHQKNPELEEKQKQAKKYYKPEKLKAQSVLTTDQTKAKYMDVFSTITLPGKINRYWLEKDKVIF